MNSTGNLEYSVNSKYQKIERPKISIIPVYIGLLSKSGVRDMKITNIQSNKELDLISGRIRQYFMSGGLMASRMNHHFGRVDFYKLADINTDILAVSEELGEIAVKILDINSVESAINSLSAY